MTTQSTADLLAEFTSPSLSPSLLQPLIHRLLSHPSIYNGFVDILNLPTFQSALTNNPQRDVIIRTLELFGFGTVDEYYKLKDDVMKLNDVQLEKLKMLSVVSIVKRHINDTREDRDIDMAVTTPYAASKKKARQKKNALLYVPYAELISELHLPVDDIRKLEDLLIQCIYANLLSAKLDQCSHCLVIEPKTSIVRDGNGSTSKTNSTEIHGSILSRDLSTTSPELPRMISQLESFLTHSTSLLATLDECTLTNTSVRKNESARWKEVNRFISETNANTKCGALEPREMDNAPAGEWGVRREVKRSKMQDAVMQRLT